jgi:hypothetical protein
MPLLDLGVTRGERVAHMPMSCCSTIDIRVPLHKKAEAMIHAKATMRREARRQFKIIDMSFPPLSAEDGVGLYSS